MRRHEISDADWGRGRALLPTRPGPAAPDRMFLNAVLRIAKTGAPWRDLPERFGPWNSAWRRFDRWSRRGIWADLFAALQDPDLEWLVLDSTVIRAHPCAAGAKKSRRDRGPGRAAPRAEPGRVRDQDPRRGERAGAAGAADPEPRPGRRFQPRRRAARRTRPSGGDRRQGYDKQALVDAIEAKGGEAVIPARSNRTVPREIDAERYKDRNLVGRFWAKLKQSRRVATRYEKTARNFLAIVQVVFLLILPQELLQSVHTA